MNAEGSHRETGRAVAMRRIRADPGPGPGDTTPVFTREELRAAWGLSPDGDASPTPPRPNGVREITYLDPDGDKTGFDANPS